MQKEGEQGFLLQPRSVIVGPQITRVNLIVGKSHKAVAVGFHPGGLYRLLGIPMTELYDDGFNAEEILGADVRIVNDKLREAAGFDEIKDIIENFLLKRLHLLKEALPFDLAMQELLLQNGNQGMDMIASLSCLSLRQFERKCKERIGIPPKFFSRLARFSKAYRLREMRPDLSWTNITYECGYFDQMHLIRDFKQFAGVTPRFLEDTLSHTPIRMQANIRI
ncbi:helix-turn-helix domain-containing protein [Flavihumibacter sediminis]|nr:helix-turn-helix domain-containing protein [Flavihumibacter sediminis]